MGKGIVYCSVCGDRILECEFDRDKAVTLLGKDYCPKCAKNVVKQSAKKREAAAEPAIAPPARIRKTQSIPLANKPTKMPVLQMPFIIAIVIGVAALILLIVVLSRGGS
jgi:hypothetical protein